MADFKDRLPKQFGSLSEDLVAKGETAMIGVQRRQFEKAVRDAEKRAASLRQKAEKTEGALAKSRLEEAAAQADVVAEQMRRKIDALG